MGKKFPIRFLAGPHQQGQEKVGTCWSLAKRITSAFCAASGPRQRRGSPRFREARMESPGKMPGPDLVVCPLQKIPVYLLNKPGYKINDILDSFKRGTISEETREGEQRICIHLS